MARRLGDQLLVAEHPAGSTCVERFTMSTAGYLVEGLAGGEALATMMETVGSLSGMTDVAMNLDTIGGSPLLVVSGVKVGAPVVRTAVERAGIRLLPPRRVEVCRPGDSVSGPEGRTRQGGQRMLSSVGGTRS